VAYRVFLSQNTMNYLQTDFMDNLKRSLNQLYDRDKRLNLNGENFWIVEKDLQFKGENKSAEELVHMISHTHLINVPHAIPFVLRAKIFQHLLILQRVEYSGHYIHPITITRATIVEDAFAKLFMQKFNMKKQLAIKFFNELGQIEEGIDGGGLFKEFIVKVCEKIFDPEYGFFKENE